MSNKAIEALKKARKDAENQAENRASNARYHEGADLFSACWRAPIEEDDGGGPAIAAAIYGNGIPANGATDQQMADAKRAAEEWLRGLV